MCGSGWVGLEGLGELGETLDVSRASPCLRSLSRPLVIEIEPWEVIDRHAANYKILLATLQDGISMQMQWPSKKKCWYRPIVPRRSGSWTNTPNGSTVHLLSIGIDGTKVSADCLQIGLFRK